MNNTTPVTKQSAEIKAPFWLLQETQDDDFLKGLSPANLEDSWEEAE
jgi:hypothetical protein